MSKYSPAAKSAPTTSAGAWGLGTAVIYVDECCLDMNATDAFRPHCWGGSWPPPPVELPGVSPVALQLQSGRHATHTIRRRLKGDTTRRPFVYRNHGSMATISRFRAPTAIGRLRLAGFPAWHLAALTGFKHRLSVVFNWTVGLLGGGRAERVITLQQVFGRHALATRAPLTRRAARRGSHNGDRSATLP